MYQRELRGRLMGEKITPRQFSLLYKVKLEKGKILVRSITYFRFEAVV